MSRPGLMDVDHGAIASFLFREAKLLDGFRFSDWLEILTPDIRYRLIMPRFVMADEKSDADTQPVCLMDETFSSLSTRVRQLMTPAFTIAENPRSWTRRHITNVLVNDIADDGTVRVCSNALIYRSRGSQAQANLFSIERTDCIHQIDGTLRLARRDAVLGESVVSSRNVSALF